MPTNANPVIAAFPGGGWQAVYKDDNGFEYYTPVVGWLVQADGNCRPFTFDQHGDQADPTTLTNFVRLQEPRR
ncbi:hypothetical protein [Streptomyces capoamus]|uniref:hypothetical protein n=1 Tax=Streptomyces capoamus TaxID=68183 RepID=UPI003398ACAB